jgi:hypothetical protein
MKRTIAVAVLVLAVLIALPSFAQLGTSFLERLPELKDFATKKVSSFDRTGGNQDYLIVPKDTTVTLADITGPGSITHIWFTISCSDRFHLRKIVLKIYWDGEKNPSVNCPVGDFFGLGFCEPHYWSSFLVTASSRAINSYFPMPFEKSAKIEIVNECDTKIGAFYYNIDYSQYPNSEPVKNMGRFHAQWNRENPTTRSLDSLNVTGKDNYVILDAVGEGHYVGTIMNIQGLSTGWWGEGDDMVFIDGEGWPPSFQGTGLEDYFLGAWNFNGLAQEYNTPYHGYAFKGNNDYSGQHTMYRFHILDPIVFKKSIKVTIEHGHNNKRVDDYSSVAFWYQKEPHKVFSLPAAAMRTPITSWSVRPTEKDSH